MAPATGTFLDQILEKRRLRVRAAKERVPQGEIESAARRASAPRALDFSSPGPHIIAEVKKASPSKGLLRADFDPVAIGKEYDSNGALAISVLTEEDFFLGSLDYLRDVRSAVTKPVLRKDFIFDPYQLFEGRAAGADMFLLIMAMLDDSQAAELKSVGEALGMTALVEVHDAAETERALRIQPALLGINNRNLRTFHTSLDTTLNLLPGLPAGVRVVSESGLTTADDLRRLMVSGVDSFLIGETFMRAPSPGTALRELVASSRSKA